MSAYVAPDVRLARVDAAVRRSHWLVALLALAVLLSVPFWIGSDYGLRIATLVAVYATMSLGWNLLGGYANQISLGHAVFFGMGAYTTAILQLRYGISPWVGLFIGVLLSVLLAVLIGLATFLLSGHYFALATLALLQVGFILFTYFAGITGGPPGLSIPITGNNPGMFQFGLPIYYFYIAVGILLLTLIVSRTVLYSKLGYRLRAIKGNPLAARLAGVDLFRSKLYALVISAAIVSVTGSFYIEYIEFIDPSSAFSFDVSVNMALFAIIGGVNSWWGAALGAAILVPLGEFLRIQLTGQLAPLGQLSYGVLLIVMILVRPRGLAVWVTVGWNKLVERVIHGSARS